MPGMFYAARASAEPLHRARADPAASRASPNPSSSSPGNQNAAYVGSVACSRCHAQIYSHFAQTDMGRSMAPVTPEFLKAVPLSAPVYDAKIDRHFEVTAKDGKLYQSEYQLDASGREVFRDTHAIEWIIGANANGFGGLTEHDDFLFEAPLSYYPRLGKWELSPGYQNGDNGFNRVIAPGCIFCHSGRPQPAPEALGKYRNPHFTQLTIGCENCHGPGSAHVEAMNQGESYSKGKDPTIANPSAMAPALANDICMSCHQTGDTRVFQPGKNYLDFRPGMPLDRIMAILMVPPTRDNPPREDHVEHFYSMTMSKCYIGSQNTANPLRCISCHDPHIQPTAAEAPAFFNSKCLSCHTQQSCKAPLEARRATAIPGSHGAAIAGAVPDNCIGCHMQKREGVAITHTSITNHRIVARPDEPFPDRAFTETTAALPDLIHLNAIPGDDAPPPAITLLQAYEQLKDQKPEYTASWQRTLSELEKSEPDNAIVQASLGRRDLNDGKLADAALHLNDSLRLDPVQPEAYASLSDIADRQGNAVEALAAIRKAVTLDPFNANMRKTLVLRLISAKQYEEAETDMEKYLQDFPQDDFMRRMLAIAKSN
jgi:hypothetical protein